VSIPFLACQLDVSNTFGTPTYIIKWGNVSLGPFVAIYYNPVLNKFFSNPGSCQVGYCSNLGQNYFPDPSELSGGSCTGGNELINLSCIAGKITGTLHIGVYGTTCLPNNGTTTLTFG
jgi:hypothetical protein